MTVSQNGWPVDPPRSKRIIPGTRVGVVVADGPAGDVLMYVLGRIDREVEDIDLNSTMGEADDWGYAHRAVRGSTDTSNHASATAVDVNATRHGLGAVGTFSKADVARIHAILADVDHVVRWGGDYLGRKDEMHFEINADHARVKAVADRLADNGKDDDVIDYGKIRDIVHEEVQQYKRKGSTKDMSALIDETHTRATRYLDTKTSDARDKVIGAVDGLRLAIDQGVSDLRQAVVALGAEIERLREGTKS